MIMAAAGLRSLGECSLTWCLQMYTRSVDEEYRWDDESYKALAANKVTWQDVVYVLRYAHPKIRQHIGAILRIIGRGRDAQLLAVTLIEEGDDQYLVVTARHLTGAEITSAEALLNRGQP